MVAEGEALLGEALRQGGAQPYQLHPAVAACHSAAVMAMARTAANRPLYAELLRDEPPR